MRLNTFFALTSVAATCVLATPLALDTSLGIDIDLNIDNHYGAPMAPWEPGHEPGWYLGSQCSLFPDLLCLRGVICDILALLPLDFLHCPAPSSNPAAINDGYTHVFSNLTGATEAGDYLTYGLVDTVSDCKAMCNSVQGCAFVNTYHDVHGKGGSTQLTCSLFSSCHGPSDAINYGGQTQPDGSIDFIADSDGWCKTN